MLSDLPSDENQTEPVLPGQIASAESEIAGKPKKSMVKPVLALILALLLAGGSVGGVYGYRFIQRQKHSYDAQISGLTNQVQALEQQLGQTQKQTEVNTQENQHLQDIKSKSQDQLLTDAVAQVTPAVVSVVISKEVPNLTVTYQNPFGDDPFFKDYGFRVPVYQQNGTKHQQIGAGSGFLISSNGYILTNKHVVFDDTADYTVLLSSGKQQTARVVYKDAENDIAVIKIDGTNFAHITLGDSSALKLGQSVAAIGNALGQYNNSVSVGIVSGLDRTIQASGESGTETLTGVIQTDAAINPGNSGGPLMDLSGKVVGINVATVQGSNNISFSIPINTVKTIINSVIK
jgi:S1-C subfamily serine protease